MMNSQDINENLQQLQQRIANACLKVNREVKEIRLIPVTKTKSVEMIQMAIALGVSHVGENKVQELIGKAEQLQGEKLEWILIGHLQSNKVKKIIQYIQEFHALDSIKLAEKLNKELQYIDKKLDVFIQVNTSNESSKYGIQPERLAGFLNEMQQFEQLNVVGLMTLALHTEDELQIRQCFRLLKKLLDKSRINYPKISRLSMGMSGDFEIAIEEGATDIRVGQAIFGQRNLPDAYYWPEQGAKS